MTNYESRSSTHRFLVGQIEGSIPNNKLPTCRDVIKYLFYKKHTAQQKSKKTPAVTRLICCPLDSSNIAQCDQESGCQGGGENCVVKSVKEAWHLAGIPVISDFSIRYNSNFVIFKMRLYISAKALRSLMINGRQLTNIKVKPLLQL